MTSLLAMPEAGYLLTPNGEESLPIDINVDATKGEVSLQLYINAMPVLLMVVILAVASAVVARQC
jgi:hypothetical protein